MTPQSALMAPRHRVWLDHFGIATHPVTRGDFIEFIDDGRYQRPELWLSAGWDAVTPGHVAHRIFFPPQARWQFSSLRPALDA